MAESSTDRVFLSYAKEDIDNVKYVYEGLKKRGLKVWFDDEDLPAGRWKAQIKKAISRSRYFVICISEAASFAAEYDRAIAILNSVLALRPDSIDALNNLGIVWGGKGEYDKAIEYFEKDLKSSKKAGLHHRIKIVESNFKLAHMKKISAHIKNAIYP